MPAERNQEDQPGEHVPADDRARGVVWRDQVEAHPLVVLAEHPGETQHVGELPGVGDREERPAPPARSCRVAAAQPISVGSAPGTPPASVARCERVFSGV